MVTERPPFTRWLMVPSMSSSRSHAVEISSHTFILSAFSLESVTRPSSFSRLSMKTSTLSPALTVISPPASANSLQRDDAFALAADVDDDRVASDLDDGAADDLALAPEVSFGKTCLEKGRETFRCYLSPAVVIVNSCSSSFSVSYFRIFVSRRRTSGPEKLWSLRPHPRSKRTRS